jgi:hypothetical protein
MSDTPVQSSKRYSQIEGFRRVLSGKMIYDRDDESEGESDESYPRPYAERENDPERKQIF